jgi:L-2-hydroxyglutarate oxidase LhgO
MEQVDTLIIGAGVIGLAIAEELSKTREEIVVVEKEASFGRHTSSRNSEVIHSGIYYPPDTLKATLCVRGVDLLYEYLDKNNIPYNKCGKLVVASGPEEITELARLKENGIRNGVQDLNIIDSKECQRLEPDIKAYKALKVPSTGIMDTHLFMKSLVMKSEMADAYIIYNMEVAAIKQHDKKYVVSFTNGEAFRANTVINSAGLYSDRIAEMVGIDIRKNALKLHWCKGEYFKSNKIQGIKRLIYPIPDNISLGIHLSINLSGNCRFGPNAYYVDELDYSMDETHKSDFLESINQYLDIDSNFLEMDDCGIRPKLQKPGDIFRDFYIKEESEKGFINFINIIGIESPGLTASLAIAEYVSNILN